MNDYSYPKSLENFILLEKLKEQKEQQEKMEAEEFTFDYMEPVPISFPDKPFSF